ncbi:MAG: hypothetical protein L6R48_26190, partial [Planctomycetes bacterium]|nr:hypothetical protein [Planctomycetota bacterium]
TIDYCVVKIPRFAFEKFPAADPTLTTQMKSVGEVMAIGRTFKESLQKALRGLEIKRAGLGADPAEARALAAGPGPDRERLTQLLSRPNAARIFAIRQAFKAGFDLEKIHEITNIDPWFLRNIQELIATEERLRAAAETLPKSERPSARSGIWLGTDAKKLKEDVKLLENLVPLLRDAKRDGFSDAQIGCLWGMTEDQVRELRYALK